MNSPGNNFNKPLEDDLNSRKEKLLKLVNFLKRIDSGNSVEDLNKKKEFIQNLTFKEFQDLLLRINGILRNTPIKKRVFHTEIEAPMVKLTKDGNTSYVSPPNSEKIHLLQESFEALKRMNLLNKNTEAAIMMGASVNAIHPFEDGNGRTARVISLLLASSKEKFFMTSANPESIQPFIEFYISEYVYNLKEIEILGIEDAPTDAYPPEISERDMYELGIAKQDDLRNFINACRIFVQKEGDDLESLFISPNTKTLSLRNIFLKYKDKIPVLIKTYRQLKNKYVEVLIDIFENPQKYKIKKLNIFKMLPKVQKEKIVDKTILDLFYNSLENSSMNDDEFSWDYLIKLIEKQPTK